MREELLTVGGILACIVFLFAFTIMCWYILKRQQNKNFQRNMQKGDDCFFTLEGGREHCHIKQICDDGYIIIEDLYGSFYRKSRKELYV